MILKGLKFYITNDDNECVKYLNEDHGIRKMNRLKMDRTFKPYNIYVTHHHHIRQNCLEISMG